MQLPGGLQLSGDVPQGHHHSSGHALHRFEVVVIQLPGHALYLLLRLLQLRLQLPASLPRPARHKLRACKRTTWLMRVGAWSGNQYEEI